MSELSIWSLKGRFAGSTLFALMTVPAIVLAFGLYVANNKTFSGLSLTSVVLVHGVLTAAWFVMLAAQAWFARSGKIDLHRTIGRTSYILAPAVFLSMMAVFIEHLHRRVYPMTETDLLIDVFNWINPIAFILCWGLAIRHRKNTPRHMRYMIATILAVGSPIVARLLLSYFTWIPGMTDLAAAIPVQFAIILGVIGWLIARDRSTGITLSPYWVPFGSNLLILIGFYTFGYSAAWSAFMYGFAGLAGAA
ncbi:MAG: hypothetical protein EP341_04225 [Sphingomonadales bacterium]|nr:MAG: hypothetical protein EP341_04225 [Sphingomonadales bacterium]